MLKSHDILSRLLRHPVTSGAALAANFMPVIGAIWFGWDAFTIVVLYWMENVIVGLITVLKMALCRPDPVKIAADPPMLLGTELTEENMTGDIPGWFAIPFFTVHYGIFTAVHGFFVFSMLGNEQGSRPLAEMVGELGFGITLVVLFASHLIELTSEYIIKDGNERTTIPALMFEPYRRVIVMHLAVLFGGFAAQAAGSPLWALFVLVSVKTLFDLLGLAISLPANDAASSRASPNRIDS